MSLYLLYLPQSYQIKSSGAAILDGNVNLLVRWQRRLLVLTDWILELNRTSRDIPCISARLPSILRTLGVRTSILICLAFPFLPLHIRSQCSQVFLACIFHKTMLLQSVSCLHRWAIFSLYFSYKQHAVSITELW